MLEFNSNYKLITCFKKTLVDKKLKLKIVFNSVQNYQKVFKRISIKIQIFLQKHDFKYIQERKNYNFRTYNKQ